MSKSTVEASLRMLEAIATLADAAMVLAETLQDNIRNEMADDWAADEATDVWEIEKQRYTMVLARERKD
jgi:hypothetical protein